ncbi:MAG: type II secretion system protein [Phycisphaerales bacterium]
MKQSATSQPTRKPRPSGRGFSLLEVVIVCAMLAIVAAMAMPRFLVVDRQREEKAISDVEDLLRMFAFRNSVGTQQIGLHYNQSEGEISLWILDLNPKDPEGPRVWQQDRLSSAIELPEQMTIVAASADETEMRDEIWTITSNPDGSRPRIAISLAGREAAGDLVLDTYSSVPVRTDKEGAVVRQAIDLDGEGRGLDRW